MSIKDNIKVVKNELKNEEKFLEGSIKVERFIKKHKSKIIFSVAFVIGLIGFNLVQNSIKEESLLISNKAYLDLQDNPSNISALNILKENNKPLYELFIVSRSIQKANKMDLSKDFNDKFLKDIALYQLSILENNPNKYTSSSYTFEQDLAIVLEAYKLIKEDKIEEAHNKLSFISMDSSLQNFVKSLLHYK